jgi:predicted RNA methylase
VRPGQAVLEPSAGTGHLADAVRAAGGDVHALEMQPALRKILELKGHKVAGNDALAHDGTYDRIVMNPPFEQGADMHHIQHAFEHNLKPGGRLVAILSEGPFFREDRKAQAFRAFLTEHGAHNEKLPAGSFTQGDVPTGVNTRIVVLDKPGKVASASNESAHNAATERWQRAARMEPDERRKATAYEMADMHVRASAAHRTAAHHNTPHMHDLAAKHSNSAADAEATYASRFPEVHKAVHYRVRWAA